MIYLKRICFLGIYLFGIFSYSFSQNNSNRTENYCNIYFGDGFGQTEPDLINLDINNVSIYKNKGLYSLSYGSSPGRVLIIRVNKKIIACTTEDYPERVIYLGRIGSKNSLIIDTLFRSKKYRFKVDLKKGKFLVLSVSPDGNLENSQHLTPPAFY